MPALELEGRVARADMSRFLAACFYEPTPVFIEEGLFESMRLAAARVSAALADRVACLGAAFAAADEQVLRIDHARLFVGPFQPLSSPYASHWLAGRSTSMDDPAPTVLRYYEAGGFDVDPSLQDLPDHVAVELEFLYALTFRLIQAGQASREAEVAAIASLRQRFLTEHLRPWVTPFARALHAGAQTQFYRELAALTLQWIDLAGASSGA